MQANQQFYYVFYQCNPLQKYGTIALISFAFYIAEHILLLPSRPFDCIVFVAMLLPPKAVPRLNWFFRISARGAFHAQAAFPENH